MFQQLMKKLLIGLLFVGIIAVVGYNYLYQDHINVDQSKASASFTSVELLTLFIDQDLQNDEKALDQVIEVQGTITSIENYTIILDNQIFIELSNDYKLKENQLILIKGRCLGYDDLLEEVKIDQAVLIN
ncbi:hypothetical protein BBFL7_00149 [Flavobacteria bacterium BBFL7]|nr:hypothetical protein BBFL7_00149 [Flavobacteria bacterium BBFL7]